MIAREKMRVVAAAVAVAAACTETTVAPPAQSPAPVSDAVIALVTPNTNDGAVILSITGPDIAAVQAADSHYVVFANLTSSQEARVIVLGDLVAGPILKLHFATTNPPSAYAGTVQQVATRADSVRASTSGYQLTVAAAR